MGALQYFADSLSNVINALGSRGDSRNAWAYSATTLTREQIIAAYLGSGMMRKVVRIPALDSVREWREWQVESDQLALLAKEERRLGIQAKVLQADILGRLGGGALLLGLPGLPQEPAREPKKGDLKYVNVVNRWQMTLGTFNDDAASPLFGEPETVSIATGKGQVTVHRSRLVMFKGEPVPPILSGITSEDAYWGESVVHSVKDAVQNYDAAMLSFAKLVEKASVMRLGIPGLTELVATSDGEARLMKRLQALQMGHSVINAVAYEAPSQPNGVGETITDAAVSWAGIPDVMRAHGEAVATVADIPATRLLGRSAEGMNSSGTGQQDDWNKAIMARQSLTMDPRLAELDRYLVPSATGEKLDAQTYVWPPLSIPTPKEEADRFKIMMEAAAKAQDTNTIPDLAFAKGMQSLMVEEGWLPGLESALEEIPEDERYGIEQPDFDPNGDDPSAIQAGQEQGG